MRRPPRSTLFPYPPLFQSAPHGHERTAGQQAAQKAAAPAVGEGDVLEREDRFRRALRQAQRNQRGGGSRVGDPPPALARSEEHTSELQSRPYLVCRLLLEK